MTGEGRSMPKRPPQPDDAAYILILEADNDSLRCRVEELERELAKHTSSAEEMVMQPIAGLGLTPQEGVVLSRIAANGFATKEQILQAVSAARGREIDVKIVDVYICKVRKKLQRHDIVIETAQGRGYKIDEDNLAKIAALRNGTQLAHAG